MTFKETFKQLRLDSKLSQSQLSEELGLSLNTIRSYESGRREPNSKAMVLLEKYFNVSGSYLRGETDQLNFSESDKDIIQNNLMLAANSLINAANKGPDPISLNISNILVELRNLINAEQKIQSDQYSKFVGEILVEAASLARKLIDHNGDSNKCVRDCAESSYKLMNCIIEFQNKLIENE